MNSINKKTKLIAAGALTAALLISAPFVLYLNVIPAIVQSPKTSEFISKTIKKEVGLDVNIKDVKLKTSLSPQIDFSIKDLSVKKEDEKLVKLENFDSQISFANIFKKQIEIKKLGADLILVDADGLMNALPQNEDDKKKEEKPSDWDIDLFDANLYVKKIFVRYNPTKDLVLRFAGKNLEIKKEDGRRFLHFDISTEFNKNNKKITLKASDKNRIYTENKRLIVDNFDFKINNSTILINAYAARGNKHRLEASSKNFNIKDVIDIVESDLVISNGSTLLTGIEKINGSFDSKLVIENGNIDGEVILNKFSCILQPLNNLPLTANKGIAKINNKDIILSGFEGFYGKKADNKIVMQGGIYDYFNTAKTNITADTVFSNEFAKDYLSKLVGYPLSVVGKDGKGRLIVDVLGENIDMQVLFKLPKGDDILVDGMSLSPVNYDRAAKAVMHIKGDNINIETINYYIAENINKGSKIKPILTLNGNVSMLGEIRDIGFDIPKPLPSEFLNLFVQGRVFRKGTIAGNLHYINNGKTPKLEGHMKMDSVRIPAQRLSIKEGTLTTNNSSIMLSANGKYRRTAYDVSGDIKNELLFPIIVNSIKLNIDELNIEKIMQSFTRQAEFEKAKAKENFVAESTNIPEDNDNDANEAAAFMPGMLEIKDCLLSVEKGSYKDVLFANVLANLTLSKEGLLKVDSNRFEIAEGHSSAKVECDLMKHLYRIRLGIKEVNSDIMATSLLALQREITGKASGIIDINTDDSLKLNGLIKFEVKDGSIQKVGLVEYVLKFASLFRNPLAMISPSTFSDFVNIPEGNFDRITGDLSLKNNVVNSIKIKSYSPQLSAYVVGRFDLESRDAILRIYTKMTNKKKGIAGALRNISLNSLANRVSLGGRNDSNYYAAELAQIPDIDADEKDCQIFLTKVDGDVEHNNFISSLKRIK